ncbi:MAG: SIMPL domain-containing protein [Bacteroidia bacterium]
MKRPLFVLGIALLPFYSLAQNKQPDVEREIMVNTITQTHSGPKKIVVTGSAEMDIEPDQVDVNFVLAEYLNNRKEKVLMEDIRKEFLKACADAGIPKDSIRVEGLSGGAYADFFRKKRKDDQGLMEQVTFVIRLSGSKQIDAIASRLNDKAVTHMYISRRWHSRMSEFKKELRIKATKAALEKATYMADAIGEQVEGALLIEDIDGGAPVVLMHRSANSVMESMDAGGGGDASLPFQKINIRSDVRAEFELKRETKSKSK